MSDLPSPEISVIIVNYGTAELAIAAVHSVLAWHHGGREIDIHVVDNASPGGDADVLRAAHADRDWGSRVTVYAEQINHGFGRANNLVLRALATRPHPPDKVFLLNPDAQLDDEAPNILAAFLDSHPSAGCAGASITNPDGRPATAAFRFPSATSEYPDSLALGPVARLFQRQTDPLVPDMPTQRVQGLSSATAMLRWEAVWQCRGFDPNFLLYFEEVDLMRQLARHGWETWHVPEARVVHIEGAATKVKSGAVQRSPYPHYRNDSRPAYHVKAHVPRCKRLSATARLLGWKADRAMTFFRRHPALAPQRYLDGFTRRILRPLAGLPAMDGV